VQNNIGYWLKFPAAEIVNIFGGDRTESVLSLSAGWNLIGGPNCNVPLNSVIDPGGIIIPGSLYGYSGSYTSANSIDGTKAYWIKTNSAGNITISCGSALEIKNDDSELLAKTTDNFSKIEVVDAEGNNQLFFSMEN
jgi:hypothetical protein